MSDGEALGSSRLIEIITVLVLGVTTLGTAWCSYEAYQWNNQSGTLSQQSSAQQLEANRLFGLATQEVSYDSSMLANYAVAYQDHNDKLIQFYRQALIRPALLPFLDSWIAQVKAGHPPQNLLSDQSYLGPIMAPYNSASAEVSDLNEASNQATDYGNRYLVTTILLAIGLFFGGVTSSFRWTAAKLAVIALAVIAVALAASRLVDLPVRL